MHKLFTICAGLLVAACAFAKPKLFFDDITMGTNTAATVTNLSAYGSVEDISVTCSDVSATATATVSVVSSGFDDSVIATGFVTGGKLWRPVVQPTDASGDTLTNATYRPLFLYGVKVVTSITASDTGKVWRSTIKTSSD
jgi:hypothetical protein